MLPPEQVLLFFLPAMAANLMLYFTGYYYGPSVVVPLDLRLTWKGARVVGEGRGLTSLPRALVAGLLVGAVTGRLEASVLLAVGAQLGMVVNSVIKRRRGLLQGQSHRPWDHLDFVLGAALVYGLHFPLDGKLLIWGLVYCGLCHWIVSHLVRAVLEPPK